MEPSCLFIILQGNFRGSSKCGNRKMKVCGRKSGFMAVDAQCENFRIFPPLRFHVKPNHNYSKQQHLIEVPIPVFEMGYVFPRFLS